MGYTTYFNGQVDIEPPLNQAEADYLRRFAGTRRMRANGGPYETPEVEPDWHDNYSYNEPPEGQPGLWCDWVPGEAGDCLVWDESEKFYYSAEWMKYLIDHFLKPGAAAQRSGLPQFAGFTFDHVLNGVIDAEGEDTDDRWQLVVEGNVVKVARARPVSYGDAEAI